MNVEAANENRYFDKELKKRGRTFFLVNNLMVQWMYEYRMEF